MMLKTSDRSLWLAVWMLLLASCGGDNASDGPEVDASAKEREDILSDSAKVHTMVSIGMELVPQHVAGVLETKFPGWSPNRIIESDQGGGIVIYEFFGKSDDGEDVKVEVKWEQGHAELLIDEWVH